MKAVEIVILILWGVAVFGFIFYQLLVRHGKKTAYFTGGPLHGMERRLPIRAPRYVTHSDALYKRGDDGIYTYAGDVDDDDTLQYRDV